MKFFSLLYEGEIHLSNDDKVIPAEDFSTLLEAKEVLERAVQESAEYKKKVEEECQELKRQAADEGRQEGLDHYNEQIVQFALEHKKLQHEMQKQILPLALKAAKKIVGTELKLHPEVIVDIVQQAIAPVLQNRKVTIYVNKADREWLEKEKPRLKELFEHLDTLSLQERADLSPGGCIIETESGIINATIENQWRALEAAFDKYMKHG